MDPHNDDVNDTGDVFGTTELDADDDAPSDSVLPFHGIGFSPEDHRVIFNQRHPTNNQ